MGMQTMGSQSNGQRSHFQQSPLARHNSWPPLTLAEMEKQFRNVGKPLGSMNLEELLNNVWNTEAGQSMATEVGSSATVTSLQRQTSMSLARALSDKSVDQVWQEIQDQRRICGSEIKLEEREPVLGELTLEDFLIQAGIFTQVQNGSTVELAPIDGATSQHFGLSPSPSVSSFSGMSMTTSGRKRSQEAIEKSSDKKLKRKLKNRESAARSRAKKQAYHEELMTKIAHLEAKNMKLKKEKEFEMMLPRESSMVPKYQLRRTSSASF